MRPVYITRLSKFFPNDPISNDEMEAILGMINNTPSKARKIVLRNNGIKNRYYAYKNGEVTHTNAQMASLAIQELFKEGKAIQDLQLLTAGTTSPEQLLPSHAAMIHGALGIHRVEISSHSGACCSSIQGLKYAFMSIASGMADMAASVGSERMSSWMHASRFEPEAENMKRLEDNPILAFEKDFLRWMLSDGAGAALLESKPNQDGISLKIEWLEITSFANELETCMYAGAVKKEDKSLEGWNDMKTDDWMENSVFSLKQDTRLLGENIVPKGGEYLAELMKKHQLKKEEVDYYLPHMSSEYFKKQMEQHQKEVGMDIPPEKWFYNLPKVGNVGAASPFIMLEELFNSGKLKKGERLLMMIPESARFSYAYIYLTVV